MSDPTYVKAEIESNSVWALAFWLSEVHNDNAPIGWGKYIPIAEELHGKPRPDVRTAWDICERFLAPKETDRG